MLTVGEPGVLSGVGLQELGQLCHGGLVGVDTLGPAAGLLLRTHTTLSRQASLVLIRLSGRVEMMLNFKIGRIVKTVVLFIRL